jgi:excalibur calcium-binding domain-containing protein
MPFFRKALLTASACAIAALLLAALPAPASAADKDCKDFATQRAAQIFFLKHGGPRRDPDRLDADHDGVACEDNPCPCYRKKHLPRLAIDLTVDRRLLLRI